MKQQKQQQAAPAASGQPTQSPQAAPAVKPSSLRGTQEKAPRIRQVIARRMRESLDVSTQLTQVHEVDMTKVAKLRAKAKNSFQEQNGAKLTFLPFILNGSITTLTSLDFLGFGLPPGSPSLGELLAQGKANLLHDAESRVVPIGGSVGTRDRISQGKRDRRRSGAEPGSRA